MTQNQDPDRWFRVTKRTGGLSFLLYFLIIIVAVFEYYPKSFVTLRAKLIMGGITIIAFVLPFTIIISAYSISKDKRLRHKNGYNSKKRHTLTILVFYYFSGLLYMVYYIFARYNNSNKADETPRIKKPDIESENSNTEFDGDTVAGIENSESPEYTRKSNDQWGGDGSTTSNGDSEVSVNSENLKSGFSTGFDTETNQASSQEPESQEGSIKTDSDRAEPATDSDTNTVESGPIGNDSAESALKYCTQCGAKMPADGAFCTECGNELL